LGGGGTHAGLEGLDLVAAHLDLAVLVHGEVSGLSGLLYDDVAHWLRLPLQGELAGALREGVELVSSSASAGSPCGREGHADELPWRHQLQERR